MRAPEALTGVRIVGPASVLDAIALPEREAALRLAPDDLLVLLDSAKFRYPGPEPLIQEDERGFVGWWLAPEELEHVAHHADWPLPAERPALAQGLIAGVPARLWLGTDRSLLLCSAAYAHELIERLG